MNPNDATFEELLDLAASKIRGRRMTEEEWDEHRALWAGLGVVLAHCREPVDKDDSPLDDAYDRAMDFLSTIKEGFSFK